MFDIPSSTTDKNQELIYGMEVARSDDKVDDDDVKFYRFPVSINDFLTEGNGISDGAILLSRDALELGRRHYG